MGHAIGGRGHTLVVDGAAKSVDKFDGLFGPLLNQANLVRVWQIEIQPVAVLQCAIAVVDDVADDVIWIFDVVAQLRNFGVQVSVID